MSDKEQNIQDQKDNEEQEPTLPKPPPMHEVEYDTKERVIKDVPPPIWEPLPSQKVFDSNNKPQPENIKNHFIAEGRLSPDDAMEIIQQAAKQFSKEKNLLRVKDPVSVCGDVHGQFYDLLKILDIGGDPAKNKYLFLGDYVDRGFFATEVVLLMLTYKVLYPDTFLMIRGNHECRHLTAHFNFKKECLHKYNEEVYDAFMDCFDCLPLAAILNERFLCLHGGLSPKLRRVEEIENIDRFREPPPNGPMCDVLWADPMEEEDETAVDLFRPNELRGCSYTYSYYATCSFLKQNNLLAVIRAHEAQDEGYRLYRKNKSTGFPTVICIFSAPNYCDVYGNKGAIIRFQDNFMNIKQFNCNSHPYCLPNFMNVFDWSLPFVADKVTDMLQHVLELCEEEDESSEEEGEESDNIEQRADLIRNKIMAVSKLSRMYRTLREESESVVLLKGLAGGEIPRGLLLQGPEAVREAVKDFQHAKELDAVNEKRPTLTKDVKTKPDEDIDPGPQSLNETPREDPELPDVTSPTLSVNKNDNEFDEQ